MKYVVWFNNSDAVESFVISFSRAGRTKEYRTVFYCRKCGKLVHPHVVKKYPRILLFFRCSRCDINELIGVGIVGSVGERELLQQYYLYKDTLQLLRKTMLKYGVEVNK